MVQAFANRHRYYARHAPFGQAHQRYLQPYTASTGDGRTGGVGVSVPAIGYCPRSVPTVYFPSRGGGSRVAMTPRPFLAGGETVGRRFFDERSRGVSLD